MASETDRGVIEFEIPGRPMSWKRTNTHKGKRLKPKEMRARQNAVKLLARAAGCELLGGAVKLEVECHYKDRRGLGDVDNLAKLIQDALEGVAYANDRQVCELVARRVVDGEERTIVRIEEVA